jgi:hypothetical protein
MGSMDWIDLIQNRDRWGLFKSGYEPSGYIKCGEIFDVLRAGQPLKKESAP